MTVKAEYHVYPQPSHQREAFDTAALFTSGTLLQKVHSASCLNVKTKRLFIFLYALPFCTSVLQIGLDSSEACFCAHTACEWADVFRLLAQR